MPPAGLLWQTVSPAGAVTQTLYDWNGDVSETISPLGLKTFYSYDGIGRKVQQKVVSDTYTLITTYAYDADGRVTQQTDPPVTDRVTGAVHTGQVTSTYDADGDLTSQATADTTGQRRVPHRVGHLQRLRPEGDVYRRGRRGHAVRLRRVREPGQPDRPGRQPTQYAYDPNGRLLTTTLANYTGSPPGSQAAAALIEESRAYDPAGRLASVTDAMGRVTSYAYTDDGLTASVTRTGPGGGSYTQETDTYDPAGNLITKVTNNGATTTNYSVDAASRVASQTLDPAGLNRVTAYTYTPDDHVATRAVSQGSGSPLQTTSYTYDLMGNKTSQTGDRPGRGRPGRLVAAEPDLRHHRVRRLRLREHRDRLGGHLDRRRGEVHRAGRAEDHHPRPDGGHHGVVHGVGVGEPGRVHRQRRDRAGPGRGGGVRVLPRDRQRRQRLGRSAGPRRT